MRKLTLIKHGAQLRIHAEHNVIQHWTASIYTDGSRYHVFVVDSDQYTTYDSLEDLRKHWSF